MSDWLRGTRGLVIILAVVGVIALALLATGFVTGDSDGDNDGDQGSVSTGIVRNA